MVLSYKCKNNNRSCLINILRDLEMLNFVCIIKESASGNLSIVSTELFRPCVLLKYWDILQVILHHPSPVLLSACLHLRFLLHLHLHSLRHQAVMYHLLLLFPLQFLVLRKPLDLLVDSLG